MNIQNAPLLIGILVFSHTYLTVGILLNIYSVTDCTHYNNVCFRTVHLRLSVVSLGTRGATNLDNDPLITYVCKVKHPTCDSACL